VKKWIAIAALALLAAAFYLRPLSFFFVTRKLYLRAIGVDSEFVQVGRHRIHYFVHGDGPPLLLVHGVAMRAEDFSPLLRRLSRTHRVYAPDLLGYGESDQPRGSEYSVATQTEVVRGFMDAVGLKRADVVAVSMGGWIAAKLAVEDPQRVGKLILIAPAGLSFRTALTETSFSATTIAEQRRSFALQTDRAAMLPDFVIRDFVRLSKKKSWIVKKSMRSMLTRSDLLLDGKLRGVRAPVLMIWGTHDRIVPFALAARMQREMPHARRVPVNGCGHLVLWDCTDRVLPPIVEFLQQP
jgi:pimeloyl-ACP methyl ester carboxylesterase